MERRWKVLMVVVVGVFMAGLDVFIVNIAFPQIHADFPDTSLASLSWILNSYTIVFAAFLIAAGRWSDGFGRKRAFLLGVGLFVAASAACAAAPSIPFLVGARAVQGLGAALLMPASLGLLLPEFPPRAAPHRDRRMGGRRRDRRRRRSAPRRAARAGRLALGVHRQRPRRHRRPDRRKARAARDPPSRRRAPPDLLGAVLLTAGVAALTVAIVQGESWGWSSAAILVAARLSARADRACSHDASSRTPRRSSSPSC